MVHKREQSCAVMLGMAGRLHSECGKHWRMRFAYREKRMSWLPEMTRAYSAGLEDARAGHKRGCPNDFFACYDEGWRHGRAAVVREALASWNKARQSMREYLEAT